MLLYLLQTPPVVIDCLSTTIVTKLIAAHPFAHRVEAPGTRCTPSPFWPLGSQF